MINKASSSILLALFLLSVSNAEANPAHPKVTAGKAEFHLNNKTLEIAAGDHTIISWESFSIDAKETTRFTLPNKDSVVLNRVSSLLPSTIDGHLNSNGIVYLINPNGILVTPNGIVDTAGFLASTLDISDQDFLKQGDLLFSGESLASVVNQGSISCWNGDAILIATQVKNENSIEAPEGVVGLASGHEVLLIPEGKEKITVRLKIQDSPSDGIGVHQTGSVQAIQAELKADGNLYAYAIKNEGIITATGFQEKEGRIFLVAEGGHATTSGSLAAATGDHGGEVHLLGDVVSLTGEAVINVSGNSGGGTVLIGGDFQGSNAAVLNSRNTFIEPTVNIKADALQKGDGGKVIVWGDATTAFLGNISAKGGEEQGNGGFVEVSGEVLDFYGLVDTSALQGKTGQLLLDPITATISNAVDSGFNIALCPTGTYTPNGIAAAGNIQIAPLLTSLNSCSVTITSSGLGAGTGDITFASAFPWAVTATPHTLTINAFEDIVINAAITNTTTAGSIVLNAGRNISGSAAGTITFGPSAGSLTMTAASNITVNGLITYSSPAPFSMTATTGNIQQNPGKTIALNTNAAFSMNAPLGNVTVFDKIRNVSAGAINVTCGGTLNVGTTDQTHPTVPVQIGSANGNLTFNVGGDVIVEGGFAINTSAQIGFDTGPVTSDIIFTKIGGNLILTGGFKEFSYAVIGHGIQTSTNNGPGGVFHGNITIGSMANPVGGDVLLSAKTTNSVSTVGQRSFAQIGHLRSLSGMATTATGDIDISHVSGQVSLVSGNQDYGYTLIGHGGGLSGQSDTYSGTVRVHSGGVNDISLLSGLATQSFSAIGHVGYLNAAGTVTINASPLIEVISANSISMQAQRSSVIIGGYVTATSGMGNVTVDAIHVETLAGDLLMIGANPGSNFNGVFIGAISRAGGGAPIVPAGNASSNLTIITAGLLRMQTGLGGTANNNFTLIQNGIGTPMGFPTTINVGKTLSLFGGNNFSEIQSIGPLTITCGDNLTLAASPFIASLGDALILSAGTTTISASAIDLLGFGSGPKAAIENSLMDLTISATNSITLTDHSDIEITGGSGTLSITSTAGSLSVISDAAISNLGSGLVFLNINQSGFIEGALAGPASISSMQDLTATFGQSLFLTSIVGGAGSITSNGDTSITATGGRIFGVGESGFPVLIQNTAGNLTLTAESLFLEAFGRINLVSGMGTLTLNATVGNIYLGLNSTIQNAGSGPSFVTSSDSVVINSDALGPSSITTSRALTVNANRILMLGVDTNIASLTADQDNLSITASSVSLGPNALIALNGGSGQLSASLTDDLLIFNNSNFSNFGSGNTVITAAVVSIVSGTTDAMITNNTGTLTMNLTSNLSLISNIAGSASITSAGPMNINAENIFLGGLAVSEQSSIVGSAGNMLLIAQNDITIANNAFVQNLGAGTLTLVVDQQLPLAVGSGRFILDPEAQVITASGMDLRIFTSQPNGVAMGNLAFGLANGNAVTMGLACPFDAPPPSATYQYLTFFNTFVGGFGVPFTIFFKLP